MASYALQPTGYVLLSGGITFAANFKKAGKFPANGFTTLTATVILAFIFGFMQNGPLAKPVHALALLMFVVVLIRYIPGLSKEWASKK